ncbi:glucans biosynthesis glucosyltransferase MdoH [Hansschlegelia zhihuaiae]|uniref:Glucans biosynthesis glucosyltransferase H n=1 Tax=Hansschlegelia zhihuaiae TaxID=405005 RepID=A0A4Q0MHH9_9HYPH|nr:glucans biosynthesis glucosyltransferase MdoH [Hansschlegelia zhihuaiae]RXF72845.1 glucans biosynthesis glucosyltransferase MdoH [Hansschlegelia zhihuaiae]
MRSSIDFSPARASRFLSISRLLARTTPTGTQSVAGLAARRIAFSTAALATLAGLGYAFASVLSVDGWSIPEFVMLGCFLVSAPWIVIGFWNALIGFVLLRFSRDPVSIVAPCVLRAHDVDLIEARTAIAMCIRHEDSDRVVRRLDAVLKSLDATGYGDRFDIHVLSDSARPDLVAEEEAAIAEWRRSLIDPDRVTYRRRTANVGFKAGNIRDFVLTRGRDYDFMVTLDADSVMSGEAILRLVRVMQANPKLGILQSLVVGLPARTVFARAFQFGMRASMRSYSMGAAWWAGDCGPYWGHNAAIRVKAFRDHCELPTVPGGPPLGGAVLSHDLYEAVLMRKGGYEVRVLPEEGGSWEDNPASLPEFLRRNLRWCQGNMQYLRLIGSPGLPFMGRVNLAIAILMYAGAPAWITFMVAGAAQAWEPPALVGGGDGVFPWGLSTSLLAVMMLVLFAPKIMGYLDVVLRPAESRRYGGAGVFLAGVAAEIGFGLLFAPIVSFSVTAFLIRLFVLRRPMGWDAQNRDGRRVRWSEAIRSLWPATLFGAALAASLALSAPQVLPWAAPVLIAYLLAAPFAVVTSIDAPDADAPSLRLVAVPEEVEAPAEVVAVAQGPAGGAAYAPPMAPFRFDDGADDRGYSAAASPAE